LTASSLVRHPFLAGHRLIGGLWFPSDWFDETTRQRLLLQAWRPNSSAYRFANGDLLRWPEATMQNCASLSGWPLQQIGSALASASLTADNLSGQPTMDVWLVLGAERLGLRLAEADRLDPSAWLSVEDLPFIDTWDLKPPAPPQVFVGMEPPRDVREVLGGKLSPASAEAKSFLNALSARSKGAESQPAATRTSGPSTGTGGGISVWAILGGLAFVFNIGRLLSQAAAPPPYNPPPQVWQPSPTSTTSPSATTSPLLTGPQNYTGFPDLTQEATRDGVRLHDLKARQDLAIEHARQSSRKDPGVDSPLPVANPPDLGIGSSSDQVGSPYGRSTITLASPPPAALNTSASGPSPAVQEVNPAAPLLYVVAAMVVMVFTTVLWILVRRFLLARAGARSRGLARAAGTRVGAPSGKAGDGADGQASRATRSGDTAGNGAPGSPAPGLASSRGQSPENGAASGVKPRMWDRVMPQRWRAWLARIAMTTGVSRVLGRQHAAYVRRMLAMFEEGHIEDALKHAIPLGQGNDSLGQLLGRLGPRADLSIRGGRGAAVSVGIDMTLEQHLRNLYRSVFTKLDREGRVDEAAFVLAELLRARSEALDYLERHDRCKQAAELALGWDMPPAQIIRLLALTGDWRRALLVARRDNAFSAAVTLLQARSPEVAARLRREWAQSLVEQGRWLAAVDAIWPLTEARGEAETWLKIVEEAGGTSAARALAMRSQCLPETLGDRAELLRRIQGDPSMVRERAAMALQLLALEAPVSHVARSLAAGLVGPTLADHDEGQAQLRPADLRKLVEFAADPVLKADMPPGVLSERRPISLMARDSVVRWQAPEAGLQPLHDAVPLLDGEFLVAIGEPGLLRLDARGRRIGRIEVPAHRIVVAHDGRSALALARRGAMWRVSRLDLVRMKAHDLGHLAAQAFADQYDGLGWTIANGTRVQVLDTSSEKLDQVLWQVADLPGPVVAIEASEHSESWLLGVGDERFESWRYLLPRRTLTHREPIEGLTEGTRLVPDAGLGVLALTAMGTHPSSSQMRPTPAQRGHWPSCPTPAPRHPVRAAMPWLAMRSARQSEDGSLDAGRTIDFTLLQTGRVQACVEWPAEVPVLMRVFSSCWLLHDLEGRLAVVSLQNGWIDRLSVV
jgi:hypothetical protein